MAANYKWEEFCNLDGYEQSEIVAAYRIEKQADAVVAYENRPKKRSGKRG